MGESERHIRLVATLGNWVTVRYLDGDTGRLLMDLPSSASAQRPPYVNGFVPDLYVEGAEGVRLIIGEAKTPGDLESVHTRDQLCAFLRRCGQEDGSLLALAVPWHASRLARGVARAAQRRSNTCHVRVVVLEGLPG